MTKCHISCGAAVLNEIQLMDFFSGMKCLSKKKSSAFWHVSYLQRYIKEKCTPFGLRIQIFSRFQAISKEFKQHWEENINNCTLNMMKMLIDNYQTTMSEID